MHHVSVSINVSHSTLVCGEAWGTDPHFSWLYERKAVTQSVGRVSQDGTTLVITKTPICGLFTCMVSNKLGYSTATYTAGERLCRLKRPIVRQQYLDFCSYCSRFPLFIPHSAALVISPVFSLSHTAVFYAL